MRTLSGNRDRTLSHLPCIMEPMSAAELTAAHDALVAAMRQYLAACGELQIMSSYVRTDGVLAQLAAGPNLAEGIAAALTELAGEMGGVEALVRHRPGCWEAGHIRDLVVEQDWAGQ